uniref:Crossover junction endonuclease MUS81 n=1 Tax=Neogobius melanostomus TaxID=47308 RepID=A0A8C6TJS3_9GOBI
AAAPTGVVLPNPLFLKWLTELRDEAKEKEFVFQAINSLNKYPLPLKNAKEAKILQNFGDGICRLLDERLQKHYRQNGEAQCKRSNAKPDERGSVRGPGCRGSPSCSLISFTEFNHGAVKNKCQTVREVFTRQLMQISGLSGDKAVAVIQEYPTPHSLLKAYDKCSNEVEKEKLLSSIRYGKLKRNLGPALSRTVYQLYCTKGPLS